MVGLVLVSHSRPLALAVQDLVRSMTGPSLPLAVAAGAGDDHKELGTDAVEISQAIFSVQSPDGVLVLMDMGSAILSAETAVDLLDEAQRPKLRFCAAPFVEGAVAAGVTASLGASLDEVYREAMSALKAKETSLGSHAEIDSAEGEANATGAGNNRQSVRLTIKNAHGLHARPAARLIQNAAAFRSTVTVQNLSNSRGPVSAKSLSSLASLEILQGQEIEIVAEGDDAGAAIAALADLVRNGLGESLPEGGRRAEKHAPPAQKPKTNASFPLSSGIAIGPAFYFKEADFEISHEKTNAVAEECSRLEKAVATVRQNLGDRAKQMQSAASRDNAGIYEAQQLALQDPDFIGEALRRIRDDHDNAALAWSLASEQIVSRYQALQDDYLRERAVDVQDISRQVLALLTNHQLAAFHLSEPSILVTDDLTPQQVSTLSEKLVLGVVLLDGGPTSHSSILLKALGLPTIIRARSVLPTDHPPVSLAFDGDTGEVWVDPNESILDQLHGRQKKQQEITEEEKQNATQPGATSDGHRIEIFANVGGAAEALAVTAAGGEGIGLLRTEFLFLDRSAPPTEEEQVDALKAVFSAMKGQPVIVRTLDAGGDKELPYLQMPPEQNPFLGVRAIRLCFRERELFQQQMRAILRAGISHNVRLMFPMIADLADLSAAKTALQEAHLDLEQKQVPHLWPVSTGIMIEIPSAALQAAALADQVDFFSVGTNDLTQYTLAADRGNPALATYQDALHPSVLKLIATVVAGARAKNRLVAVCGEAASDELAAAIFVGLGVTELSMTASKIGKIKASLRTKKMSELQELAEYALSAASASETRIHANKI